MCSQKLLQANLRHFLNVYGFSALFICYAVHMMVESTPAPAHNALQYRLVFRDWSHSVWHFLNRALTRSKLYSLIFCEHVVAVQAVNAYKVEWRRLDGSQHYLTLEEGETMLEAMLEAGLEPAHDCKMGVCMTCPAKLV